VLQRIGPWPVAPKMTHDGPRGVSQYVLRKPRLTDPHRSRSRAGLRGGREQVSRGGVDLGRPRPRSCRRTPEMIQVGDAIWQRPPKA